MINYPLREDMGVTLLGEANRDAPAQAELRPTCAGASAVNQHLILTPMGWALGRAQRFGFIACDLVFQAFDGRPRRERGTQARRL
jgi:hypothetical protein